MAQDKFQDDDFEDIYDDEYDDEDEEEPKSKKDKKIDGKEKDPNKYVDLEPTLANNLYTESKSSSIVLTFGRFSPPTIGHEKLVNKVMDEAIRHKSDAAVFLSHTEDKKKNPLSYDDKLSFMTTAFGKIVKRSTARSLIEVLKQLQSAYDKVTVVVGADRVPEFDALLGKYNGKEFNFNKIDVISAGERDPDADDVTGMSASKMRAMVVANNLEGFTMGLPKKLKSKAKEVFDAVRKGMKLMEDLEEETLNEKVRPLTYADRLKRARTMKRYAAKIERAKERALLRRSNPERMRMKARRRALDIIRKRLAGNRDYGTLTPSEKIQVDKRASRFPDAVIARIAQKQVGVIRKLEADRLSAHNQAHAPTGVNIARNEAFENFVNGMDVNEQFDNMFENYHMDVASHEPKQSLHKKKFHNMFRKEGTVKTDARLFPYRSRNIAEDTFDLMETVEELYGESSEFTKKIADMEARHQEIRDALKDFNKKLDGAKTKGNKVDLAKEIIDKHNLSFTPKQLVNLHGRIKNAEGYKKAFNNIDAFESVEDPSKREWGTPSLTKTYRDDTPGQEDMDIVEANTSHPYHRGLSKSTIKKRQAHFEKGKKMDDDNPAAYKKAPGDATAKTKESEHTKKFKQMYGEETLQENEEGLKNKAEKTGISLGILRKVYNRGVAAWRTGHRPGTTPSQWGMARVNSFATGGKTRTTADKDLWAKHSKNESVEEVTETKKPGLWANIHARRKKGLPPKKPGEKGYPETLNTEGVTEKSFKDAKERVNRLKNRTTGEE